MGLDAGRGRGGRRKMGLLMLAAEGEEGGNGARCWQWKRRKEKNGVRCWQGKRRKEENGVRYWQGKGRKEGNGVRC